jgi:hypothetical protein
MFRDLFIGGFLGIAIWLWRTQVQRASLTLDQPDRERQIGTLQQQLAQTQQELAIALERYAQAETQIAELNQLATDRAIELIQLQVDNAELISKIAELSQKRTRKKRTPKVISEPVLSEPTPPPSDEAEPIPAFALNLDLIQEKQVETTAVTQLLQTVFVEESLAGDVLQTQSSGGMIGLDATYAAFLQTLSQQLHWRREDLAQLAQQADLLLDGALEVINEAAFERCDEPLTDGEDPIELNPDVLQVLLS